MVGSTKDVPFSADSKLDDEFSVEKSTRPSAESVLAEDDPHYGLEFPTDEEIATLRRIPDTLPWASYLIALVEMAERFSFYGCSVVFTNFIQQPLPDGSRTGAGGPDGQSGALGRNQQTATGLTTFYQFWCYVIPLLGAYMADVHWGRYHTVCVGVGIAFLGHVILIISSVPGVIEKEGAIGVFAVALIVTGFGTGLFKANISPLVAEQYKRTKLFIKTTDKGERLIVDPAMTISRTYMYFYLFTNIGALIGQLTMAYSEKYVGFWLAYTLPTVVFMLCPLVLWAGRHRYTRTPPTGSVMLTAVRLWRFAMRGRWSLNPITTFKNMNAADFWESAKPSHHRGESLPAWMTFDDQWVDEVRRGLKACTVFLWYPLYWLSYNQINNNLTSQAATMTTHGVPNDVLSNLDPFALIILIPFCDMILYPGLNRMGLNFSAIKRMTAGYLTGCFAMIWAGVLQHYIYKTSPCGNYAATCDEVSPLNVWIQTGSYILIAFSEIFASVTGLEYAFTKAPKNMRSLVMGVFLFMSAIASAIGEAFIPLVSDPLLMWNYLSVAIIAGIAGILFWVCFRHLDAAEDELNRLPDSHFETNEKDT